MEHHQHHQQQQHHHRHCGDHVAVAVHLAEGSFPSDHDYCKIPVGQKLEDIVKAASEHFKLTDTSKFVAKVDDKDVPLHTTFAELGDCCFIDIEWHLHEGGGGA